MTAGTATSPISRGPRVTVELVDDELRLEVDRREGMSDRFTRLIEEI